MDNDLQGFTVNTRVVTAHIPRELAEQVDQLADIRWNLDRIADGRLSAVATV